VLPGVVERASNCQPTAGVSGWEREPCRMSATLAEDVDPVAVLAALGISGASEPARVTGGTDTLIWRVEVSGSLYALRLFRAEQHETCHREQLAMSAAEGSLPIPRLQVQGVWEGRPALLLSWCPGQSLGRLLFQEPHRVLRLGARFGQMHARMHAVSAPTGLRDDPNAWIEWAGPIDSPLRARLRDAAGGAAALLHLDYHPGNVMTDGRQITAVLDWANARAGDLRADLARTVTLFRLSPIRGIPRWRTTVYRRLLELAWRVGCARTAGYPRGMALFHAWAGDAMLHDYSPRLDRPGTPYTPELMDRIRRWTARWKQRAGVM
jgi:aminoglycoside phosphotransferase (APT) family kinase protein